MSIIYPAQFEEDFEEVYEGGYPFLVSIGFVVTFRDVPEAITQGDNFLRTIDMAKDALLVALKLYDERGQARPTASAPIQGDVMISLGG